MCRAFSCVITKQGKVIWQAGKDSHDELISIAKLKDDTTDGDLIQFAKIEITPDKGYLYPEDKWTLKVDENTTPRWLTKTQKDLCWVAFGKWKEQIYSGINLKEALNPINPLNIGSMEVTEADKILLKEWASVRDSVRASVRDSVRASVWDSVRASVRDSVGAYIGSLFLNITEWKYAPKTDEYPYQPCSDLWKRGFISSLDGKTWRLHSGKDAKIVYEWTPK
jgi:hypothetical protein